MGKATDCTPPYPLDCWGFSTVTVQRGIKVHLMENEDYTESSFSESLSFFKIIVISRFLIDLLMCLSL